MAEITTRRVQLWQTIEHGYIGQGDVIHGSFTSQEEAWARRDEIVRRRPELGGPGIMSIRGWLAELVVPPEGEKGE